MEPKEYNRFETALLNAGVKPEVINGLEGKTKISEILDNPLKFVVLAKGVGVKFDDYIGQDFMGELHKNDIFNAKLTEDGAARVIDIGESLNNSEGLVRAEQLAELGKIGMMDLYFELTAGDMLNVCDYETAQQEAAA